VKREGGQRIQTARDDVFGGGNRVNFNLSGPVGRSVEEKKGRGKNEEEMREKKKTGAKKTCRERMIFLP